MSKKEWKETGKSLGHAFKQLAKTSVRSASRILEKADNNLNNREDDCETNSVFADGSWKEAGKDLGEAFTSLGKSILHCTEEGLDKAEEFLSDDKNQ